jgi:hypothetical protein
MGMKAPARLPTGTSAGSFLPIPGPSLRVWVELKPSRIEKVGTAKVAGGLFLQAD